MTQSEQEARQLWRQNVEIDRQTDFLVKRAEKTITDMNLDERDVKVGNSQLSNLLGVAGETESVEAIKNWIRYQMGRSGKIQSVWKQSGLGNNVLKNIEEIGRQAKSVTQTVYSDKNDPRLAGIYALMVRRYAGYLRRAFIARKGTGEE